MPEYKKQHYVPRLLMRHFSHEDDQKFIGIYNPDNRFFKNRVPLYDQAQEDYFYGITGQVEAFLGKVEGEASTILKNIIISRRLPNRDSNEYLILFLFVYHMAFRTKAEIEKVEKMVNVTMKEFAKYDPDLNKINFDGYEFKSKNLPEWTVSHMHEQIHLALDLEAKLLVNISDTKFVMSDNPLARYNQFMEGRKARGGHLAPFAKGLQMFLPISPEVMILYYDKWAYDFTRPQHEIVHLTSKYDVDAINAMQFINCTKTIFFNHKITEDYVIMLTEKYDATRKYEPQVLKEAERFIGADGNEHIRYHYAGENKYFNLRLSFLKTSRKANNHVLSDYAVQLRDERVRRILSEERKKRYGDLEL